MCFTMSTGDILGYKNGVDVRLEKEMVAPLACFIAGCLWPRRARTVMMKCILEVGSCIRTTSLQTGSYSCFVLCLSRSGTIASRARTMNDGKNPPSPLQEGGQSLRPTLGGTGGRAVCDITKGSCSELPVCFFVLYPESGADDNSEAWNVSTATFRV